MRTFIGMDANGRVGTEQDDSTGGCGYAQREDEAGRLLRAFANKHQLVNVTTVMDGNNDGDGATWTSSAGYGHRIDYILLQQEDMPSVMDCGVTDLDALGGMGDHRAVKVAVNGRWRRSARGGGLPQDCLATGPPPPPHLRLSKERLQDTHRRRSFAAAVAEYRHSTDDPAAACEQFVAAYRQHAEDCFGVPRQRGRRPRGTHMTPVATACLRARRQLRTWHRQGGQGCKLRELPAALRRILREVPDAPLYLEALAKEGRRDRRVGRAGAPCQTLTRALHKSLGSKLQHEIRASRTQALVRMTDQVLSDGTPWKAMRRAEQIVGMGRRQWAAQPLRDEDGNVLPDAQAVADETVYAVAKLEGGYIKHREELPATTTTRLNPPANQPTIPRLTDVLRQVARLRNCAPGPDGITTELLKAAPLATAMQLQPLLAAQLQSNLEVTSQKGAVAQVIPKPSKKNGALSDQRLIFLLDVLQTVPEVETRTGDGGHASHRPGHPARCPRGPRGGQGRSSSEEHAAGLCDTADHDIQTIHRPACSIPQGMPPPGYQRHTAAAG